MQCIDHDYMRTFVLVVNWILIQLPKFTETVTQGELTIRSNSSTRKTIVQAS